MRTQKGYGHPWGVTAYVRGQATRYRCDYCGKTYLNAHSASHCASQCAGKPVVLEHAPGQLPVWRIPRPLPVAPHASTSQDEAVAQRVQATAALASNMTPQGLLPAGYAYEIRTILIKKRNQETQEEGSHELAADSTPSLHPHLEEGDAEPKIFEEITDVSLVARSSRSVPSPELSTPTESNGAQEGTQEPKGPFRKPGQKSFIRKDARYECTVCKSHYFTRDEVEKCFMGHPLEPKKAEG